MIRAARGLFRMWLVYVLAAGVLWTAVDIGHCRRTRLNFLRGRVEQYLLGYESGQEVYSRELFYLSARYFQLLHQVFPNDALFLGGLGYCRFQLGAVDQAEDLYRQAMTVEPGIYTFYLDLGEIFFARGDFEQAGRYLADGIQRIPSALAQYAQLEQLLSAGQTEAGQTGGPYFKSRARRDEARAFYLLAQCAAWQGDYPRMREVLAVGLRRHPQDPELKRNLRLVQVLLTEGAGQRRAALADQLRQRPEYGSAALHLNFEWIFLRQRVMSAMLRQDHKEGG